MKIGNKRITRFVGPCFFMLLVIVLFPAEILKANEFSEASIMAGVRQDSLDWNINGAGNPVGSSPNILSELTWRDLKIFQVRGELSAANASGIYFRGSAGYGWVLDGENQDSDYAGNDRTLEFSRSINDVDGSRVFDFKGGLGVEFPFGAQARHRFIPLIGYAYHAQQLRMTNGNQVVSNSAYFDLYNPDPTKDVISPGPFPGLHSSYDAIWSGGWLGADFLIDLDASGSMTLHLERHWPKYEAKANWNLRGEFAHPLSFEQEAKGQGLVVELGWHSRSPKYEWAWGASMKMQRWNTEEGIDRTFLVIPGPPCNGNCYTEGILNEVNWTSKSFNITLSRAIRP